MTTEHDHMGECITPEFIEKLALGLSRLKLDVQIAQGAIDSGNFLAAITAISDIMAGSPYIVDFIEHWHMHSLTAKADNDPMKIIQAAMELFELAEANTTVADHEAELVRVGFNLNRWNDLQFD